MPLPSRHLSVRTAEDGRKRYAAIYAGQPLCADRDTLAEAWAVLKHFVPSTALRVDLWDGDLGEFRELCQSCLNAASAA